MQERLQEKILPPPHSLLPVHIRLVCRDPQYRGLDLLRATCAQYRLTVETRLPSLGSTTKHLKMCPLA